MALYNHEQLSLAVRKIAAIEVIPTAEIERIIEECADRITKVDSLNCFEIFDFTQFGRTKNHIALTGYSSEKQRVVCFITNKPDQDIKVYRIAKLY